MKTTELINKRLSKDRPMTTISIRMPQDVLDDLKHVAPMLGFSGYQPLIRAYIGKGLRADLEKLQDSRIEDLAENLRKRGISEEVIAEAIAETRAVA